MEKHEEIIIGGIEGGGTHSSLIVMNGKGDQLTHIKGPSTNHWQLGMKETAMRIANMIQKAKEKLNIPDEHPLDCVGLCLSGCEEKETNEKLVKTLQDDFPNISKEYVVESDTIGSLQTGCKNRGIVLIAGTGSNGFLVNSDGTTSSCGGWGHMMGDEGSAYWIAHKACKYVFDDIDGLEQSPASINYIWDTFKNFFQVKNQHEMLRHLYNDFDKSKFAMVTEKIAYGCQINDELSLILFSQAGQYLAKHLNGLMSKNTKIDNENLRVICVGSVWKSWEFLKKSFIQKINESNIINEFTLLRLTTSAAVGACYVAADKINCNTLIKTHEKNCDEFFYYKRDKF